MLVLLLLSAVFSPGVEQRTVAITNLNSVHDDFDGSLTLQQVIWYDWDAKLKTFVVCDYRNVINCPKPKRDRADEWWVTKWKDGDVYREVRSRWYFESKTFYDPEISNRQILPLEKRRTLNGHSTETDEKDPDE